jgi:glyoxylase-like metal-dependent hydrolase (beta-lactamase superfamily II)
MPTTQLKPAVICLLMAIVVAACTSAQNNSSYKSVRDIKPGTTLPSNKFFTAEKVRENILRIRGAAGELMYLVEGNNKAVLIDAGTGVGDLSAYVKQFTSKPITVIITHGHVDHAFGAANFKDVYMSSADDSIYIAHSNPAVRKGFLRVAAKNYDKFSDSDFVKPASLSLFKDIKNDTTFDLGGTTLEVFHDPGHTPGQLAILFKEQRILLTGDGANQFTFLFSNPSITIGDYENILKTLLAKTQGKFDSIFVSHGPGGASKALLSNLIALCEDIKAGKSDEVPFNFMNSTEYIAKKVDFKTMSREDGGEGNIVYSKTQVN